MPDTPGLDILVANLKSGRINVGFGRDGRRITEITMGIRQVGPHIKARPRHELRLHQHEKKIGTGF